MSHHRIESKIICATIRHSKVTYKKRGELKL